jgi:hypothetical protein
VTTTAMVMQRGGAVARMQYTNIRTEQPMYIRNSVKFDQNQNLSKMM